MRKIKITIAIPVYNSERIIAESIESALSQTYPMKEVLVIDDASTDRTVEIIKKYPVRLIQNKENIGIGKNLEKLMDEAKGKYIIYLCGDDQFTCPEVVRDYVSIFDNNSCIGMIGRMYYQYMDGHDGAIMVCRDRNIITSSCNPSGMAFRVIPIKGTNKIFIEMPSIVAQYLQKWQWTMLEYDTVKARIHPGGNTGTKTSYYKGSQIENWVSLVGPSFRFNQGFIQIKNRAPKLLCQEIKAALKYTPDVKYEWQFWFYVLIAIVVPGFILRPVSNWYRHRISRHFCTIIKREG